MDENGGTEAISRSLELGWDFDLAWRHKVVEKYLVAGVGVEDPLQVLGNEKDAYCRQYYFFRRTGGCMSRDSFLWSYKCFANNRKTGAASLAKAMAVARYTIKEIAAKLRTPTKNVAVFMKLFFDVQPYLDDREWLASQIFQPADAPQDLAAFRETRWMSAAFTNGREGLERAISRKVVMDPSEREKQTNEIRAILTARAHEYFAGMQSGYVPPNGADFDRLLKMIDVTARQPVPDDKESKMQLFIQSLHGVLKEKANRAELANDEGLQILRQRSSPDPVNAGDADKSVCA